MFHHSQLNNDCWQFTGSKTDKGYGQLHYKGITRRTHRMSAFIFLKHDLDDNSMQINHMIECKNKDCWNPEHIYIGTSSENQRDIALAYRRLPKKFCKYGHALTDDNISLGSKGERNCKICARERANRYYRGY